MAVVFFFVVVYVVVVLSLASLAVLLKLTLEL